MEAWHHLHPRGERWAHPVGRPCDWVGQDIKVGAEVPELPEGLALGDGVRRLKSCVEDWPEAQSGEYNPSCCRFPKSCSADSVLNRVYTASMLEDPAPEPEETHQITISIGGAPSPEAVAARPFFEQKTTAPTDAARTVEEWRVTGEPGHGYPTYSFTFSGDRYDNPETSARKFIELHETVTATPWTDGPHLSYRTVTYTAWEGDRG